MNGLVSYHYHQKVMSGLKQKKFPLIINVEGNFDTIQNGLRNQGVLGTVWK